MYQLRRWYEQFYVDAADVTPDMVDRFEFEIDTTRPSEHWTKEVEDEPGCCQSGRVGRRDRRADNRLADAPMAPVELSALRRTVLVRKSSWYQTSVQWTATAHRRVPSDARPTSSPRTGPGGCSWPARRCASRSSTRWRTGTLP